MDGLEQAAIVRAQSALSMALANSRNASRASQVRAFADIAYTMFSNEQDDVALRVMQRHTNELVAKASAHVIMIDDLWSGPDAAALAAAYIESISELSLLDQISKYARTVPARLSRSLVASGFVANITAEGFPKPVRQLNLDLTDVALTKATAIVVMSEELARATGGAGRVLFERELGDSITRATNQAVLDLLTNSGNIQIAGTGDPLNDLRAGLRAAPPSNGFVVAAPSGDVADLSTRVESGGMSLRGGQFAPGIAIVAVDELTAMHIIPASRLAILTGAMQLRSAKHASLDMRDTPGSPAQMVSMWQTNSLALLAEREFHLAAAADADMVVVG